MDFLEPFQFPFMQRAFVAGVLLAVLLAGLGVFVNLRRMAFFGEGIAHASLAGISIAIFAGLAPLPIAIVWSVIVALLIYWLERSTKLSSDTLIGILFTASMATGVVVMSYTQVYQPELLSFLFGSILAIKSLDLVIIAVLTVLIVFWILINLKGLTLMSLSEDSAKVTGVNTKLHTIILYVALAVTTVLGVKILGIILISALLILPSATARLLTSSFRKYFISSIFISEITIFSGLLLSYYFDLPSGAIIVLVGTVLFFLSFLVRR